MPETTIVLRADADTLFAILNELSTAQIPPEVRHGLIDLFKIGHEFVLIESNSDSASAIDVVVRFYPSERLRMLHAAFRAGNVDGLIVK